YLLCLAPQTLNLQQQDHPALRRGNLPRSPNLPGFAAQCMLPTTSSLIHPQSLATVELFDHVGDFSLGDESNCQQLPTPTVNSVDEALLPSPEGPDSLPESLQGRPVVLLHGLTELFPAPRTLSTWTLHGGFQVSNLPEAGQSAPEVGVKYIPGRGLRWMQTLTINLALPGLSSFLHQVVDSSAPLFTECPRRAAEGQKTQLQS
ncbi:hypothetical protein AMECASPLE_032666, partial [Ameca splendens]